MRNLTTVNIHCIMRIIIYVYIYARISLMRMRTIKALYCAIIAVQQKFKEPGFVQWSMWKETLWRRYSFPRSHYEDKQL